MAEITPEYPVRRPVVLVADDNSQICDLVATLLQEDGHHVLSASDGLEGLELSRNYHGVIDLVIADVQMPHLNGIDLCASLLAERPGIKALVMSSADTSKDAAQSAGFSFLPKPFDIETLVESVRMVLADSVWSQMEELLPEAP